VSFSQYVYANTAFPYHSTFSILLKTEFILREKVVKLQHKMKTTREKWLELRNRGFSLVYHEKPCILKEPERPG